MHAALFDFHFMAIISHCCLLPSILLLYLYYLACTVSFIYSLNGHDDDDNYVLFLQTKKMVDVMWWSGQNMQCKPYLWCNRENHLQNYTQEFS